MAINKDQPIRRKRIHIPAREEKETTDVSGNDMTGPLEKTDDQQTADAVPVKTDESTDSDRSPRPSTDTGRPSRDFSSIGGVDLSTYSHEEDSQNGESGRQLTFDLAVGELPSVLQFISADKRSGKLEITVANQTSPESVFFKDGEIYFAEYRNYEGVEALARVVNQDRLRAVFTYGVTSADKNISKPFSSLILDVLVRADELAAENKDEPPTDKKVERATENKDEPPPDREKEEKGDTDSLSSRKEISIHPKGQPALHAEIKEVGAQEELIVPLETGADSPKAADGEADAPAVETHTETISADDPPPPASSPRLAWRVVECIIFVVLLVGVFYAYQRFERFRGTLSAASSATGNPRLDKETLDAVKTRLTAAEEAVRNKDYNEARQLIERVLAVDPGNAKALNLRDTINRENARIWAAKTAREAVAKIRELEPLKTREWAAPKLKKWPVLLKSANQCLKDEKFHLAIQKYREIITGVDALLAQDREWRNAMEKQRDARDKKARAEQLGVMKEFPDLWSRAENAERKAESYFGAGVFQEAVDTWAGASELYQQGAAAVADRAEVNRLMLKFKDLKAVTKGEELPDPEKMLAKQAAQLAAAAESLAREGKWGEAKLKWRQAVDAQRQVATPTLKAGNQQKYADLITKAKSYAAASDWNAARRAYTAALAVPGFEKDVTALKGVGQANKELLIETMNQAAADGRWRDAKNVAENVLRMDPNSAAAKAMMTQVKKYLVVSLTIHAVYDGSIVQGAQAIISGIDGVQPLSKPIRLSVDEEYHIRVWAPPRGETYFETSQTIYKAQKAGEDTLIARMRAMSPPQNLKPWRVPGVELNMVYIKPGTFEMGSLLRPDEQPVHNVTITYHFWMGVTETTNHQYRTFLKDSKYDGRDAANQDYLKHLKGSSAMSGDPNYPICYVSWQNAMAFCEWLTEREREGNRLPEGYVYRLPTEAEWEYCARFGSSPKDGDLDSRAWYKRNTQTNQPVGQLHANEAGLKDMLGNVWEFCYDYYDKSYYTSDGITDPVGPDQGVYRVMRGGSHVNPAELCRPGYRSSVGWKDAEPNVGFRVVLAPSIQTLRK